MTSLLLGLFGGAALGLFSACVSPPHWRWWQRSSVAITLLIGVQAIAWQVSHGG